jgi:hypothetical protein
VSIQHGYAKGCRCGDCRERHRVAQLKYRESLRAQSKVQAISRIEQRIIELGVERPIAGRVAETVYAEFM